MFRVPKYPGTLIAVGESDTMELSQDASQKFVNRMESFSGEFTHPPARRTGHLVGLCNEREHDYFWSRIHGGEFCSDCTLGPDGQHRCSARGKEDNLDVVNLSHEEAHNGVDKHDVRDDEELSYEIVDGKLCANCTIGPDGKHRCASCAEEYYLKVDADLTANLKGHLEDCLPLEMSDESYKLGEDEVSNKEVDREAVDEWEVVDAFRGAKDEQDRSLRELSSYTVVERNGHASTQTLTENKKKGDNKEVSPMRTRSFLTAKYF
jgi:hypothetical protein